MSLLLEALKKAEKAKEEAQRRAGAATAPMPASPSPTLELQKDEPAGEAARHIITRTELPDISPSLEILSDDLSPKRAGADAPSGAAAAPRSQPGARAGGTDASVQRAAARKVFEAKFKESNPRLPFFITIGFLGAFALGTVGYFWYQLRPPAQLVNANPSKPAGEAPVAVASLPAQGAKPGASGSITGATGPSSPIPGLPGGPPAAPPAAAPTAPTPTGTAPRPAEAPVPAKPPARAEPAARPAALVSRTVAAPVAAEAAAARPAPAEVNPKVQAGYAAYSAGDLTHAAESYQDALREEPGNRDALLGLAAVDTRSGRLESAEAIYLRLLQANPRDPHAQASLFALRAGRIDPLAAESRVKTLIAADPEAQVLHFTLGNQLAQQSRWGEAQQEYFKAFTAEPENADFAYNLAVSLDHLRQPRLALEYYQRALALAASRGASFDAAAARTRAEQLGK
jgi:Flp pilus assembly protein TadD